MFSVLRNNQRGEKPNILNNDPTYLPVRKSVLRLQFIHQQQKLKKRQKSLRLGHHHLAELVKVHGARAVLVELLEDALQLLLGEGGQQLGDET